jgi:hypothetical protein
MGPSLQDIPKYTKKNGNIISFLKARAIVDPTV